MLTGIGKRIRLHRASWSKRKQTGRVRTFLKEYEAEMEIKDLKPETKLLRAIFGEEHIHSDNDLFETIDGHNLRQTIESLLDNAAARYEQSKPAFAKRVKEVILQRFGFYGHAMTLEQVGRNFDITRERVRQIEGRALRILRHPSSSHYLRTYIKEHS